MDNIINPGNFLFDDFTTMSEAAADINIEKIREAIELLRRPAQCILCMKLNYEQIKMAIGSQLFGIKLIMVPDGSLKPNTVALVEGEFADKLQDALSLKRLFKEPIKIKD
jgi:hypothetical protein